MSLPVVPQGTLEMQDSLTGSARDILVLQEWQGGSAARKGGGTGGEESRTDAAPHFQPTHPKRLVCQASRGAKTHGLAGGPEGPGPVLRAGSTRAVCCRERGLFLIWTHVQGVSSATPNPQAPVSLRSPSCLGGSPGELRLRREHVCSPGARGLGRSPARSRQTGGQALP